MDRFAHTPKPPYYAVIFSAQLSDDDDGYAVTAARMVELAGEQPGFLGAESARDSSGFGITVSYWSDEDAIRQWKANVEHLEAQKQGKDQWYQRFQLRVTKVERAYEFSAKQR